jgi:hypothetical protein
MVHMNSRIGLQREDIRDEEKKRERRRKGRGGGGEQ